VKKRDFVYAALIVALVALLATSRHRRVEIVETMVDTLMVRDTIRDTVRVAVASRIVRTDTVWLKAASDTVFVPVEIPVEQKIYQTDDYRAVIEGFRPRLAEIEIYRNTTYVKESLLAPPPKHSRRWGIGVQAGWGYAGGTTTRPYIGVGIQYNVIMF
jgi:hypothetical protein